MSILQKLYENGFITYHRTDSYFISDEFADTAKEYILNKYSDKYLNHNKFNNTNSSNNKKGTKAANEKVKGAQEAHEAIRPTKISRIMLSESFSDIEKKIYSIIWKRTVASFMSNMIYYKHTIKISISNRKEMFIGNCNETIFDGFTILYKAIVDKDKEKEIENMNVQNFDNYKENEKIKYNKITSKQNLTKSKKRYTEATLIKQMEKLGVGRPSTYAQIINTVIKRNYIEVKNLKGTNIDVILFTLHKNTINEEKTQTLTGKENKALCITDLGVITNNYLEKHFKDIIDYKFTSNIENELDRVASGENNNNKFISKFYNTFHPTVKDLMSKNNIKKKLSNNINMSNHKLSSSSKSYEQQLSKKKIGKHSSGKIIYGYNAKYGPVIQLGEDDDPQKKFVGVPDFNTVTLEEATKLLMYPKVLGKYKDNDVIIRNGKYGYYIKWNGSNYKILKEFSEGLTLEEAINCIVHKKTSNIKSFANNKIVVRNGKYGPYILHNGKFTNIPKTINPEEITEEQCIDLLNSKKIKITKKD